MRNFVPIAVTMLLLACSDRPLSSHCSQANDCAPTEWCVSTWAPSLRPLVKESAGPVCATACSTDADCAGEKCVTVGDGATLAFADLKYSACRE